MKSVGYICLTATVGLSVLVGCGQPMQGRKGRPEDQMMKEYLKKTPAERRAFANWAAQPGNMENAIFADRFDNSLPRVPDNSGSTGSTGSTGSSVEGGVSVTTEGGSGKPAANSDAAAVAAKEAARIAELNDAAEASNPFASQVLRGMDVTLVSKNLVVEVAVDAMVRVNSKDYLMSAAGTLTNKDLFTNNKLVNLTVSFKDHKSLTAANVQGIEVSASCWSNSCDVVRIYFKQIAANDRMIIVSSGWKLSNRTTGATTNISSSMGREEIASVAKAQRALAIEAGELPAEPSRAQTSPGDSEQALANQNVARASEVSAAALAAKNEAAAKRDAEREATEDANTRSIIADTNAKRQAQVADDQKGKPASTVTVDLDSEDSFSKQAAANEAEASKAAAAAQEPDNRAEAK